MKSDKSFLALIWIFLGVLGRIFSPIPNLSPVSSLSLFSGAQLPAKWAFTVTLFTMVISDLLLAKIKGYPAFGAFSFFTYSAFLAIAFLGTRMKNKITAPRTLGYLLGSSLGFWLWTNFGVWLFDGLYAKSLLGLLECYTMALPFLRNALLGDLAFGLALFASFQLARKQAAKWGFAVQGG